MLAVSEIFSSPMISVFSAGDEEFQSIALDGFRLFAINYLFCGMNIFASGLFTALNNGKISAVISINRTFIVECIAMLVMPIFIGVTGVWLALPVAETVSLVLSIILIAKNARRYSLI